MRCGDCEYFGETYLEPSNWCWCEHPDKSWERIERLSNKDPSGVGWSENRSPTQICVAQITAAPDECFSPKFSEVV